jgi:hypothetical protein
MSIVHTARRLVPVAVLAAVALLMPSRDAAACDPVPPETRLRTALGQHLAGMSAPELEALLARLERETALARARAEKRAQAAAKRPRTAAR